MSRMLCKHFLWAALVACLGRVTALPTRAEEVKKTAEKKPDGDPLVEYHQELALGLIYYGRTTKTPEALVTAAFILHSNPLETPKDAKDEAATPKSLLDEARAMRPNDKVLS